MRQNANRITVAFWTVVALGFAIAFAFLTAECLYGGLCR